MKRHIGITLCSLLAAFLSQRLPAQITAVPEVAQAPAGASHSAAPIPMDQIGAVAQKQYSGDGLSVVATAEGARLRCVFQRMNARATTEGLWIDSTVENAKGEPFRVTARMVGRGQVQTLPRAGTVEVVEKLVRFGRPGLTEEYTVSMDGVRQDFVIAERPPGNGQLRLELAVDGAKAEPLAEGARLVLADGGRTIVYNRLRAVDARGKELEGKLEVVGTNRLAVFLDDAAAKYPVRIDPTFSDANWNSMIGTAAGPNDSVYAIALDGAGNLYIGGDFSTLGGMTFNRIAKWNGSSWSALAWGLNGPVYALAVLGSDLYAGGHFLTANYQPATGIAKWDGSSWSALGSGVENVAQGYGVSALAVRGGDLYVGGNFTNVGGVSANNIAKWNGSSWSALGAGVTTFYWYSSVSALAVSGSDLYVGGEFTTAGEVTAANIAKWDGIAWTALSAGLGEIGWIGIVYALAVSGSNVYAGGQFTNSGEMFINNIAKWDGSSWSALGSGMDHVVYALAVSGSNLYVGGEFTTAGGSSAQRVAKWDGSSWSAWGLGMNSTVWALAASGNDLFAGGDFTTADGSNANRMAKWSGSAWSAFTAGLNNWVYALVAAGSNVYAAGTFTTAGGVPTDYNKNMVAKWDGSSWSILGFGMNGTVNALAVSGNDLYAGGSFYYSYNGPPIGGSGSAAGYVSRWNGSSWSALGSGVDRDVYSLVVSGSDLYVGGDFSTAGGNSANHVAKWNGSAWTPLGSGVNARAEALAIAGNDLYAGGNFTMAGGSTALCIAKWDGNVWTALGEGLAGNAPYVTALAVLGADLYVGGRFNTAGGVAAKNISKWNGSEWSALGAGLSNVSDFSSVDALAVAGNILLSPAQ